MVVLTLALIVVGLSVGLSAQPFVGAARGISNVSLIVASGIAVAFVVYLGFSLFVSRGGHMEFLSVGLFALLLMLGSTGIASWIESVSP